MSNQQSSVITPRAEDYSKWYNNIVKEANLAENSAVRGCMVIKPYGYALWENMQSVLDKMFKDTGHQNAYFPLFVPKSLFEAEEKNAEGFAKECAVVTHYRLMTDPNDPSKLVVDPDAKLEEELIVRPTSEAIIWNTYRKWVQTYRDLPILINQWANVVRWEMRTRLFLRTAEFLWQEGHTAHETKKEAVEEAERMQEVYARFAEDYMAMPVWKGIKSDSERFAGAEDTYTIEALMQDGKALQAGTSHFLGQNFAKAFDVKFQTNANKEEYVWATSWGVSTRLIGGLIMTHSDDKGLVLPPKLAPQQVVIIPIPKVNGELREIAENLMTELQGMDVRVKSDFDKKRSFGYKFNEYDLRGVPISVGIGKRDLENGMVQVARRDTLEKELVPLEGLAEYIKELLTHIQDNMFLKALRFRQSHTTEVDNYDTFKEVLESKGGFILAHWDGSEETEEKIKEETKATIRCIPMEGDLSEGVCMITGKPSKQRVVFAKAY